ncbi:MAG: VWA domain-containing protein [Acidobacteria bacterium]|nr:VWA domain-containing protein [Acidobacteriota bacterium]MBV9187335.1 VWA domain-containing protein [Acidobacteriota bacterium]
MKRYLATAAIFLSTSAIAQMKETVNVNVIEVPVSVVDSSGNPVRGLTAANFEVYDGGKKQAITSFDKIDFGSTETANAISPLNPAARRSFLLLFDLGFSTPKALVRAQEAARNFVRSAVQPRDLVGVGTIDSTHGFRLQTAFTTDRELVESVIADPSGFRGNDPLQIANKTVIDLTGENGKTSTTAAEGGKGAALASAEIAERQVQMTRSNEQYARAGVEKQVEYLGQLAKTLRAVPGRKQVILLSEGFDAKYLEGRDARDTAAAARDNNAVTTGQYWNVDNDARYGNSASLTMLDRMAQAFRASDVVLHAIDIQGVRVQNDESGSNLNSNAGLFTISRPTGGEVFQNSNDLKTSFGRMLRAQEVVYVLAFQAPWGNAGKFHDLKVKLVNANGRVNYRNGYYENGGDTSTAERTLTTAEIIVNDIPQDDVHVAAFAAPFPAGDGRYQVPIILDINGADLTKEARGNMAAAEVFVYAFDDEGVVRDRLYQRLTFDMRKVGDRLKSGVRYYGTLVLPPGSYAIKSLVRAGEPDKKNDNEKRGYARTNVIVPKAGAVAVLPPIPIDEQPKWLLVKAADRGGMGGAYPFELNGQNFIPGATASNKVALIVYGASANELTWETTPKTKLLGTIPIPGGTKLVLQLDDPAQVSSLQVTVHKKGVPEAQTSSVAVSRQ